MEELDTPTLGVRKFIASRIEAINAITSKLSESESSYTHEGASGLTFQHVPKHMRRRAVSHNPKRLPRRLRESHIAQVTKRQKICTAKKDDEDDEEKPKSSRRYRRKPSNLLLEYNRRQRKFKWIETHIWHAKRFHMENKWNYKIPFASCEKGFRPLYRASKKGVTMRDISFYACLEICGPFLTICEKLKEFTNTCTNKLSLKAIFYTTGQREGQFNFYKRGMYPFGYVGLVQFIWKPSLTTLWLWVHPAYKDEVLNDIISGFELTEVDNSNISIPTVSNRDEAKLQPKMLQARPTWVNSKQQIKLTDLEGSLNRIRFCGPASLQSLHELLFVKSSYITLNTSKQIFQRQNTQRPTQWFEEFYEGKEDIVNYQGKMWSALNPFEGIPSYSVIPMTVRDPRAFLPQKRHCLVSMEDNYKENQDKNCEEKNIGDEPNFIELLKQYWNIVHVSPIWDMEWREKVLLEKMCDSELAKRRGEMLIPGSEIDLGCDENQIPILLINQPDSGIDLIIPAGWAMAFWVAFSYRCVRPYGLRDSIHFAYETGSLNCQDLLPPDSISGQKELFAEAIKNKETFFKFPPDKRTNLVRLSCPIPFKIEWELLLSKWAPSGTSEQPSSSLPCPNFYILRDFKLIEKLRLSLESQNKKIFPSVNEFPNAEKCIVGIRVYIRGRGRPKKDSIICIPNAQDLEQIKISKKFEYSEPDKKDNELEAKKFEMKKKHQKLMAFLRKKRKKKRGQECESVYDSTEISRIYNENLKALWTPDSKKVFHTLTREPIGYLTIGGECYSIGKCAYLGYVSLYGLLEYIRLEQSSRNYVLVRDTRSTLIYRVGRIKIVI